MGFFKRLARGDSYYTQARRQVAEPMPSMAAGFGVNAVVAGNELRKGVAFTSAVGKGFNHPLAIGAMYFNPGKIKQGYKIDKHAITRGRSVDRLQPNFKFKRPGMKYSNYRDYSDILEELQKVSSELIYEADPNHDYTKFKQNLQSLRGFRKLSTDPYHPSAHMPGRVGTLDAADFMASGFPNDASEEELTRENARINATMQRQHRLNDAALSDQAKRKGNLEDKRHWREVDREDRAADNERQRRERKADFREQYDLKKKDDNARRKAEYSRDRADRAADTLSDRTFKEEQSKRNQKRMMTLAVSVPLLLGAGNIAASGTNNIFNKIREGSRFRKMWKSIDLSPQDPSEGRKVGVGQDLLDLYEEDPQMAKRQLRAGFKVVNRYAPDVAKDPKLALEMSRRFAIDRYNSISPDQYIRSVDGLLRLQNSMKNTKAKPFDSSPLSALR